MQNSLVWLLYLITTEMCCCGATTEIKINASSSFPFLLSIQPSVPHNLRAWIKVEAVFMSLKEVLEEMLSFTSKLKFPLIEVLPCTRTCSWTRSFNFLPGSVYEDLLFSKQCYRGFHTSRLLLLRVTASKALHTCQVSSLFSAFWPSRITLVENVHDQILFCWKLGLINTACPLQEGMGTLHKTCVFHTWLWTGPVISCINSCPPLPFSTECWHVSPAAILFNHYCLSKAIPSVHQKRLATNGLVWWSRCSDNGTSDSSVLKLMSWKQGPHDDL